MTLSVQTKKLFPDDNTMGINVVLTDDDRPDKGEGEQKIFDEDFRVNVAAGTTEISPDDQKTLEDEAQARINKYKELRGRYDNQDYKNVADAINSKLNSKLNL